MPSKKKSKTNRKKSYQSSLTCGLSSSKSLEGH